jgi:RNA polymerase sigma-70 factor, ECF subfamily
LFSKFSGSVYLFVIPGILLLNNLNRLKPETTTKIPPEEESVIRKAQQDPQQFRVVYERYYVPIFRFILHRVGDKEITADLTSQVFLKALQKLHQFTFRGFPFSSWIYRIAANECNDFFRKNKRSRMVVLEEKHAELLYEEMFGNEVLNELKAKLPLILERLDTLEIQYIELRFLEDRPFKEVAEIIGVSENYAKVKTYRILDKMRNMFLRK